MTWLFYTGLLRIQQEKKERNSDRENRKGKTDLRQRSVADSECIEKESTMITEQKKKKTSRNRREKQIRNKDNSTEASSADAPDPQ